MKYCATITGWGEDAPGFLADEDCNFMILFNEDATRRTGRDRGTAHQGRTCRRPAVGDTMMICDKVYDITAVGDEALHTLRQLATAPCLSRAAANPSVRAASCSKASRCVPKMWSRAARSKSIDCPFQNSPHFMTAGQRAAVPPWAAACFLPNSQP